MSSEEIKEQTKENATPNKTRILWRILGILVILFGFIYWNLPVQLENLQNQHYCSNFVDWDLKANGHLLLEVWRLDSYMILEGKWSYNDGQLTIDMPINKTISTPAKANIIGGGRHLIVSYINDIDALSRPLILTRCTDSW